VGHEVVVPVRLVLVSRTDHQAVTANAAHVWRVRDGRVIRHCVFQPDAQELLERRGVPAVWRDSIAEHLDQIDGAATANPPDRPRAGADRSH
jgi:hypothetical protein